MYSGDVLGWAQTDDTSIRIAPSISGAGRQPADEIDITDLTFSSATLQKLGNPPLLLGVLTLAPFTFELIDEHTQPFKTLASCTPKHPNQYLTVPIQDSSLLKITFQLV